MLWLTQNSTVKTTPRGIKVKTNVLEIYHNLGRNRKVDLRSYIFPNLDLSTFCFRMYLT